MSEQPPMPEEVEGAAEKESAWGIAATLIRHGLVPVGLLIFLVFVVPKFEDIFKSFGLPELPAVTTLVMSVSHFAKQCFVVPLAIVAAFLAGDVFIYHRLKRTGDPIWYRLWGVFVLLVEGAMVLAVMLAVFLPLMVDVTAVTE